jgi:hypothetical protein
MIFLVFIISLLFNVNYFLRILDKRFQFCKLKETIPTLLFFIVISLTSRVNLVTNLSMKKYVDIYKQMYLNKRKIDSDKYNSLNINIRQ